MADFDIEGARKEGYSDSEIAEYLSKQRRFNLTGARREGYSDTEIISHLVGKKLEPMKMDPTEGMTGDEKFLAGAGKAMTDIARGAGQLVGMVSRKDVDEANRLDAPLMQSGQGKAGYITGGLATAAPAALIPGANTVAGSAVVGAGLGALQPVGQDESRIKNIAIGGAAGGAAAAAIKGAGAGVKKLYDMSVAKAASREAQESVRSGTIKAAQEEGYVIPPSATGGGKMAKTAESVGGKAATAQEASIRNQQVTNKIARREAGLGEDEPITEGTLASARERLSEPYREIANLSPKAATALENLKSARVDAKNYWQFYSRTGDPKVLRQAQALDAKVERLESSIEREAGNVASKGMKSEYAKAAAKAHGLEKGKDLVSRLRDARKAIAKNFTVEKALNVGTGDVDANIIGRILDRKGEKAITGGLQTVGKFAQGFRPFASPRASGQSAPGVGYLRPWTPYLLGAAGLGATEKLQGHPYGALAGALPLLSGPARTLALSRIMQTAPSYAPSLTLRAANSSIPAARRLLPGVASEAMVQGEE